MVIDTQIYHFAIARLHFFTQQLYIRHIYSNNTFRRKICRRRVLRQHELIAFCDFIIAEHCCPLVQLMQDLCQRIPCADAVPVGAAVDQDIGIFTLFQPRGCLCQCQLLHHAHSFSVLSSSALSSTAG